MHKLFTPTWKLQKYCTDRENKAKTSLSRAKWSILAGFSKALFYIVISRI